MRPAFLLAALAGLAVALVPAGHAVSAATLKRSVTVTGEEVLVGDIFAGSGVAAELVVGRAPGLGRKQILRLHRLKSIARAHGLAPALRVTSRIRMILADCRTLEQLSAGSYNSRMVVEWRPMMVTEAMNLRYPLGRGREPSTIAIPRRISSRLKSRMANVTD